MQAAHRLIVVVTGLPIQACIQVCIDASKVVSTRILFSSAWLPFFGASSPPLVAHPSSPDMCSPTHVCVYACLDESVPVWNSEHRHAFLFKFGLHSTIWQWLLWLSMSGCIPQVTNGHHLNLSWLTATVHNCLEMSLTSCDPCAKARLVVSI